ncbi:MAG: hypothetical protein HY273_17395 [Gammaproteobacteria bacterium]|nr:hypothetical protein [Gammaproteobacteria bacterium]
MKRSQWVVAILAVFGAWILISIISTIFFGRPAIVGCMVVLHKEFSAPNNEYTLRHEVLSCPDNKNTSNLALIKNSEPNKQTMFYETQSRFINTKGVEYNPVSFGIHWNNNSSVDIFYPPGLDIYNNVSGDPSLMKEEIREERINEINVRFLPIKP